VTVPLARDLRTRRFWTSYLLHAFFGVGVIATTLQVIDVFKPGDVAKSSGIVVGCAAAATLVYATVMSWPRPIRQHYPVANTEIRIVEGDLFKQDENLVIGMCTTFDTEVPHIIATTSVQAQFLERIYSNDRDELERDLTNALASAVATGTIDKPGKQEAYPIGTVAAIRHQRRHYFCVAYTEMNSQNEARGTVGGVWRSLDQLWQAVRAQSNGDPVAVPVLGGGQARMAQLLPAQDSIRFIALSFILASRAERVCERLDIVVRKQDVPRLDMLELRAFLKSLRPS
jgi:hypothetical protein